LELAFARKAWGDVSAVEQAVHGASDANSARVCQGGSSGGRGSHGRRLAKHPRLPCGSTKKGMRARCACFVLAVVPCRLLCTHCMCFSSEPFELVQHEGHRGSPEKWAAEELVAE
jgi:hypothetical protein